MSYLLLIDDFCGDFRDDPGNGGGNDVGGVGDGAGIFEEDKDDVFLISDCLWWYCSLFATA